MARSVCELCGEELSDFEVISGTTVCLPTERMREVDTGIISGCERDLHTNIVVSDKPPPPKV